MLVATATSVAGQPTCGNGIVEPPEECELPGSICRGDCNPFTYLCVDYLCTVDCTCPDPVCGDLLIDRGEDCDPPGSPCARDCSPPETPCCTPPTPCVGSCDANCYCPLSPPATPTNTHAGATATATATLRPTATAGPTGRATETQTPKPPVGCAGDCNGTNIVTIDELIVCVNVTLGRQPLSRCPTCDPNRTDTVTIDELIQAVRSALNGCL